MFARRGPVRTTAIVAVVLAAVLGIAGAGASRAGAGPPAALGLTCSSCLTVDGSGTTLFRRAPHAARPNASTTKIVTALVVRRARVDAGETVTVSRHAAGAGGGGVDLRDGDRATAEDLLYALLLTSSNDAAVALAEHVAGTETAFVELMNELAGALGAQRTHFVNSHGLDAPGHVSTAADLAIMAAELLDDPLLARIVATRARTIRVGGHALELRNRNPLLGAYPGAVGVKTGSTLAAGDVLVAAARRRGYLVIAVALGSEDASADCRALLDAAFRRLARGAVLRPRSALGAVVFDPAGSVPAVAAGPVRGLARREMVAVRLALGAGVRPSLDKGDTLGVALVTSGDRTLGRVRAVTAAPLRRREPPWGQQALIALIGVAARLLGRSG